MADEKNQAEVQGTGGSAPGPQPQPASPAKDGHDKVMETTRKATAWVESAVSAAYRSVKRAVDSGRLHPRCCVERLDRILAWARNAFPSQHFETASGWLVKYGHAGLICAEVLCLLLGLVAAIKLSSGVLLAQGVGLAVLLLILQYTADKFLSAGDGLIKSSPSRLGSAAFLDCLSLLSEMVGILAFLSYLVQARDAHQWSLLWVGLGFWALADAVAFIALHPPLTNLSIEPGVPAGEEAIGIMSFLVKTVVRVVPLGFGVGAIIGTVGLLAGIVSLMRGGGLAAAYESVRLIVVCACLPFAGYVLFAFYHLSIDLMRAVLALPGRMDPRNPHNPRQSG
jgi:hypothetical protein